MSLGDNDATARVEAVTLAKDVGFSPRNSSKVQWGARLLRLWDGERERKSARKLCRLGTSAIPQKKPKKKKREKVSRDPPRSWWRIQTEVFFLIERQKKRKFRSFEDVWIRDNQRIRLRFYPHHIPTIKNISKTGLLLRRHRVRSKPCLGIPTEKNWQMKKTGQQKRRFSNMFSFCDYDIIWLRSIESISIWNPYGYYDHIPTINHNYNDG